MGRPINKKYFGNLNSPYNNVATGGLTGEGGESVASVTIAGTNNAYIVKPAVSFAAPTLPGGVTAVGSAHMGVVGISSYNQTVFNSVAGQTLTLAGGTGTEGTITVTQTQVVGVPTLVNSGTNYVTGDIAYIVGGTSSVPSTVTVIASGGNVTGFSSASGGRYTVNPPTLTGAATTSSGTGTALTITAEMGIYAYTLATAGDYTALPANVAVVSSGLNNPTWALTYKVNSVAVTTPGSGYAEAPVVTFTPSGNATRTAVLTASQQNALAFTSYLTTGSSAVAGGDIKKQESSRRYLVTNSQGTGQVKLVASDTLVAGEMSIIATDYNGNTYYVTKLTSRKALLTRKTQNGVSAWVYGVLDSARWTLSAAVGTDKTLSTTKVSIANN